MEQTENELSDDQLTNEELRRLHHISALVEQSLRVQREAERYARGPEMDRERYRQLHAKYMELHEQHMRLHAEFMRLHAERERREH